MSSRGSDWSGRTLMRSPWQPAAVRGRSTIEEACARAASSAEAASSASARQRLHAVLVGFCDWARANDGFARVLVRQCLTETPELHGRVITAEAPLLRAVEDILQEGSRRGELRDDVPTQVLALAVAGLTDLALAKHWASDGTAPTLDEIPELVLGLLLGTPAGGT